MEAVWADMTKFRQLGKILKDWQFLNGLCSIGKIFDLLWQISDTIGQTFIVVNGQILKTLKK